MATVSHVFGPTSCCQQSRRGLAWAWKGLRSHNSPRPACVQKPPCSPGRPAALTRLPVPSFPTSCFHRGYFNFPVSFHIFPSAHAMHTAISGRQTGKLPTSISSDELGWWQRPGLRAAGLHSPSPAEASGLSHGLTPQPGATSLAQGYPFGPWLSPQPAQLSVERG